ncbi:MAG TPA: mechanosensitive ion channel family protein [Casimicrobiaceae bacterium]|nr:mechanosensitive ion channel family protein [Casimicrobiaceae bacterium]
MESTTWVTTELFNAAVLFTSIAVALGVLSLLAPGERRRGLIALAAFAFIMLGALALLYRFGPSFGGPGPVIEIAREIVLAFLAIAVIRSIVVFIARCLLGKLRIPLILIDVVFALGLIGYAIYRLNAVGVNLAGVVTTSAIVTGALAFSAGETLGNLWAGVSLQLENTLRLGDWVRIDDRIGQVVSIRWRSMAIATPSNETIVIPNSTLMKDRIVVLARSGERPALFRRSVEFQVDYDYAPAKVIRVIDGALASAEFENISRSPKPFCACAKFEDSGILYRALYYPTQMSDFVTTDSDILAAVYSALAREGMPIPFPQQVVELKRRSRDKALDEQGARTAVVEHTELFSALVDDERARIAAALKRLPYATGDLVFRKGATADSFYILAEGTVRIMDEDANGKRKQLAQLTAPDYFGEMSLLTGQPRTATVVAGSNVVCYRLGKQALEGLLHSRPEIAEALGHVLSTRRTENDATLRALDAESRARRSVSGAADIVRTIRQFFGLPAS